MKASALVVSALAAAVTAAAATTHTDKPVPHFKNLKVLPKNITQKLLSEIMVDEFQDDIGVSCNFCHSENKQTHQPDYSSDEKPEKQIAREMMRMTVRINQKFFQLRHAGIGDSTLIVTCGTCHQGKPRPEKF
jgi:cytochrome c553